MVEIAVSLSESKFTNAMIQDNKENNNLKPYKNLSAIYDFEVQETYFI